MLKPDISETRLEVSPTVLFDQHLFVTIIYVPNILFNYELLQAYNESFRVSTNLFYDKNQYPQLSQILEIRIIRTGYYGSIDWGALQAGITVTIIPSIILFLIFQRYYAQGLSMGSVK